MRLGSLLLSSVAFVALLSMGTPIATSQIADPNEPVKPQVAPEPRGEPNSDPGARDAALTAKIERAIGAATDLKGASVGVAVKLLAGDDLVAIRADQGYNTASNTKIVTTAAALALLGPSFTFSTGLWAHGISRDGTTIKTLYLVGGGDPSLGIDHVVGLARDLLATGVRTVERVAVDDSYFDDKDLPPHFAEQPREQAAFRAPVNAAGLGFNSFAVHIIPNPAGSGAARVILDPPVDYLNVVENNVATVSRGRARLRVETKARRGRLDVRVTGQVRVGGTKRVRRRVPQSSAFANSVVRWALKLAGVRVGSRSHREAKVPPGARLQVARRSEPLSVLVRGLGKYSNNYMAEMLLKVIGAESNPSDAPATWSEGQAAVRGYLENDVGLSPGSFVYENGSGLFKSNRFTPTQMISILENAAVNPKSGAEVVGSLAIGGVDGTLRSRMEDGGAQGLIRAKTGTLATVSALSGYASAPNSTTAVFSILVNGIKPGKVSAARDLQDRIAELLVEHRQAAGSK